MAINVDLKWSLWSSDISTWEERASAALVALRVAAAGGAPVTVYTAPKKEIRVGVVEIPATRTDHVRDEYERRLPELTRIYETLPTAEKERVEQLDTDFHEGRREGFISWAQQYAPDAFKAEPPSPVTNEAWVRFRALWDSPFDLVRLHPNAPEDETARAAIEESIRQWFCDGAGFNDDPDDPIAAEVEAVITADSFEELLTKIDEAEAELIEQEKQSQVAFDEFLAGITPSAPTV